MNTISRQHAHFRAHTLAYIKEPASAPKWYVRLESDCDGIVVAWKDTGIGHVEFCEPSSDDIEGIMQILHLSHGVRHVRCKNVIFHVCCEQLFAVPNKACGNSRCYRWLVFGGIVKFEGKRVLGGRFCVLEDIQGQSICNIIPMPCSSLA